MLDITKEVAALQRMTVDQLRAKYAEVFGERTNGRHKQWLIKRIAWRLQANAEGDLSERARRRATQLANDADLRLSAPSPVIDNRLPMEQAEISRDYKGRRIVVKVIADGFEYEGQFYKSLSAVAKAVTGSHWSGHRFFGLRRKGDMA